MGARLVWMGVRWFLDCDGLGGRRGLLRGVFATEVLDVAGKRASL